VKSVRRARHQRHDRGQLAKWRTRHVGFIFQFYHLLPVLTAYENVELPLLLLPMSAGERKRQVLTALDLVSLSDRLRHRPGQLSGGQAAACRIARAIVTGPDLIVADEPTGDLDAKSADDIMKLLVEFAARPGQDDHHGDARPASGGLRRAHPASGKGPTGA